MVVMNHLTASACKVLDLPLSERIAYIRSPRWIGYSRAKQIIDRLEDLMDYPKRHRMPNLLVVGDTNNGKSMIINRFAGLHPSYDRPEDETVHVPVLLIESPPVPDESRLYDKILAKLFAPFRIGDKPQRKQNQVIDLLKKINTKILVIDEIHNLLAGSSSKQKEYLNVVKGLGNELQIPIVGAGTKEALRAVNTDQQTGNRFEPLALPRWSDNEEFLQLLASFEMMLPLRHPSNLVQGDLPSKLLSMSEGLIGELSEILVRASESAVKSGREVIDKKVLNDIDWKQPSKRRQLSENIS
jgi:type II secretory pathway predicted ATPase ExeA